ncbi:unnamed protein product, partial [Prorocentrum cordatum]
MHRRVGRQFGILRNRAQHAGHRTIGVAGRSYLRLRARGATDSQLTAFSQHFNIRFNTRQPCLSGAASLQTLAPGAQGQAHRGQYELQDSFVQPGKEEEEGTFVQLGKGKGQSNGSVRMIDLLIETIDALEGSATAIMDVLDALPKNFTVCGRVVCPQKGQCCAAGNGGLCCGASATCCRGNTTGSEVCCDKDAVCCNGICCAR